MKLFKTILAMAVVAVCATTMSSCSKDDPDPDVWPPIEVNAKSMTIPAEGGECTFTTKNYDLWWFGQIWFFNDGAGFQGQPSDVVYPDKIDYKAGKYCRYQNDWLSATVDYSDKNSSKSLVVKMKPNEGPGRSVTFIMSVGDAVIQLKVNQPAAK